MAGGGGGESSDELGSEWVLRQRETAGRQWAATEAAVAQKTLLSHSDSSSDRFGCKLNDKGIFYCSYIVRMNKILFYVGVNE